MFAASVPSRSLGKIWPKPKRDKVPAIPPIETSAKDFRAVMLSFRHLKRLVLQVK